MNINEISKAYIQSQYRPNSSPAVFDKDFFNHDVEPWVKAAKMPQPLRILDKSGKFWIASPVRLATPDRTAPIAKGTIWVAWADAEPMVSLYSTFWFTARKIKCKVLRENYGSCPVTKILEWDEPPTNAVSPSASRVDRLFGTSSNTGGVRVLQNAVHKLWTTNGSFAQLGENYLCKNLYFRNKIQAYLPEIGEWGEKEIDANSWNHPVLGLGRKEFLDWNSFLDQETLDLLQIEEDVVVNDQLYNDYQLAKEKQYAHHT